MSAGSPGARLEASWSNWWGSPQLLAGVARSAEEAVRAVGDDAAMSTITVAIRDQPEERYDGRASFVAETSPESLKQFETIVVHTEAAAVDVTFTLSRRREQLSAGEGAHLEVTGTLPDASMLSVTRRVAHEAGRGYRFFWGSCRLPEAIGRPSLLQRWGAQLRGVINGVVVFAFGAAGFLVTARIGGIPLAGPVVAALALVVPFAIDRAIPAVEVAPANKTRLRVVAPRVVVPLVSLIGAVFLDWLAGT